MKRTYLLLILLIGLSATNVARAAFFQYGFWGPFLQIVDDRKSVNGLRLDVFYGVNQDVNGLDLGVAHRTYGTGKGIQASIVNETWGSQYGLQLGGVNIARENFSGLQTAVAYSHAGDSMKGFQFALVSHVGREFGVESRGDMNGIQLGLVSQVNMDATGFQSGFIYGRTYGTMSGAQIGIANQAGHASGVQIGLINVADTLNGLQIGLWNQVRQKERLKILPIVNWSF